MKISIVEGGGMVPIVTRTTADSASLSEEDAGSLRAMTAASGLLGMSSSAGNTHPDAPSYEITVEDDDRRIQVVLDDASLPDAVRALVAWVRSVPGHQEHIGPPGRA